jgi:molybdopterin-containing oxidoreductase family membrane subunit
VAAWCVVVSEACAGIAIAADLGHWERMYRFILSPSFESPMAWMFVLFSALFLVYVIKIFALLSGNAVGAHRLTLFSIPIALLFYLTNGYIFGMLTAQPLWGGAFVPIWFVLAALLSGGALLGLAAWALNYDDALLKGFSKVVLGLLVAFSLFEALFLITQLQAGDEGAAKALANMVSGAGSLNFWGLHVLAGIVLPMALLWGAASRQRIGWGMGLIVVTFAAARWNFVIPPQSVDHLPGLASAFAHPRLSLHYVPSSGEWLTALFVASLCLVALLIGPRLIPALFAKEGKNHG